MQTGAPEVPSQEVRDTGQCDAILSLSPLRNVTVQEYKWEKQCDDITVTRKECKTDYEVRNRTVTTQKCNSYLDNVCANYTVPQYEVVSIFINLFVD